MTIESLGNLLLDLITASGAARPEHTETIMPGYTHLQRAQPVLLAHHLLAYCEMLQRDYARLRDCYKRTDVCPLGAGALAGTTFPIDRPVHRPQAGLPGHRRQQHGRGLRPGLRGGVPVRRHP